MHEVSLCENILRILEKKAEEEKFTRVVRVELTVGELSGASQEALAFCFPLVAKNTIAEDAEVIFVTTAGNDLRVSEVEVS